MSETKFTFKGVTKEFIAEVKSAMERFNVIPAPVTAPATPAPVKMGEAVLKDGSVIKWDGDMPYAVGTPLMVIDPANPSGFLPVPDGELELQDGTILVVSGGLVAEIKPSTTPATPAPAMPDMSAQMAEIGAKFSAVTKEKEEMEISLKAEIEANKKSIEALNASVKEVFALFVKAMELPTDEPIEAPKKVTSSDRKEKMLEKLMNK